MATVVFLEDLEALTIHFFTHFLKRQRYKMNRGCSNAGSAIESKEKGPYI
jgi:hypothetical protein